MKKKLLALLLACLMAFSAFGCGSKNADSDKANVESDKANKEKIALTLMIRVQEGAESTEYTYSELNKWAEAHNIDLTIDNVPREEEFNDKLRTAFANGDTPNVFVDYGGSRTLDYIESGAVECLQPYLDADKEWYDSFYPSYWEDLDYTDEGYPGIYGVPEKGYTIALYYNKDIFAQNNLTPPETFDDLLDVCEKLTEAGIKPFQCGAKDSYRLGHLHNNIVLKMYGVEGCQALADRTMAYDSPEMIKTYQVISDMAQKGYLGTDLLSTDSNTEKASFYAQESAMMWDGDWRVGGLLLEGQEVYDRTGVIPFPYFKEEYKNVAQGGLNDSLFVSRLNKSEEEIKASVELVKFYTSPEFNAGVYERSPSMCGMKFEHTPNTPANPLLDTIEGFVDGYEAMRTDLQVYDPATHMLDTVRNALQGLIMGNTPEECGREIVDRIAEYES